MSDFYIESRRYENLAIIRNAVRDQYVFSISGVEGSSMFQAVKLDGDFLYLLSCDKEQKIDFSFVLISFNGNDSKYTFRAQLSGCAVPEFSGDRQCYKLKIPDEIVVIQLRIFQRLEIPERYRYQCYMVVNHGQQKNFLVKNISKGGVALVLHSDSFDFNLPLIAPGCWLKDVHFDFYDGVAFKETLRVVEVHDIDACGNHLLFCEFKNAKESTVILIDEFMTKIMLGMRK